MEDPTDSPVERLTRAIEGGKYDEAAACLRQLESAPDEDRKAAARELRGLADEQPTAMGPLLPELARLLTDDDRSIRLTTAKLFVAVAREEPDAAAPCIDELAARLADESEFYYVRARSAEALGYVALNRPDEVASPALLADLRIGLSFDEPEVREKLAKAIAYVAMGNPGRLRHQVSNVAEQLDDENELVRYHLATALVVVGAAYPSALADGSEALTARLDDEDPYVRGRAAEALGLLARSTPDASPVAVDDLPEGEEAFECERVEFVRRALAGEAEASTPAGVGAVDAATTDEIARKVATTDDEHTCPHCGLALPDAGPPLCPRCGTPR